MKKMIWICSVCLFTLLLIVLTVSGLYAYTDTPSVEPMPLTVGEGENAQSVSWWDYAWYQPVCGGIIYKKFAPPPTSQMTPQIENDKKVLPISHSSQLDMQIVIKNQTGVVFEGDGTQYADFAFPQNGDYEVTVTVGREKDGSKPYGSFLYKFRLAVKQEPKVAISKTSAYQGEIVSVTVENADAGVRPTGESEIGPVNFISSGGSYIAFVPISYMRGTGEYPITITCGSYDFELSINVLASGYTDEYHYTREYMASLAEKDENSAENQPADNNSQTLSPEKQAEEYRNAIWPLFDVWDDGVYWNGTFISPVDAPVTGQFGAYMHIDDSEQTQQNSGVYFAADKGSEVVAPCGGRVLYAGYLQLCGNTVVIEHGAGLKSYFYHMDTLGVTTGQIVEQGAPIGTVGETGTDLPSHLAYEVKIGNQSVNPNDLFKGTSVIYTVKKENNEE